MGLKQTIHSALKPIAEPVARKFLRRQTSYSGAGEDRLILAWLETVYRKEISKIRYCDIGANDPTTLSNTAIFYELGASGVLIEPDPDLCTALRKHRPRDIVLNVGVAFDERRSAKFKRMTSKVFNTFSNEQATRIVTDSHGWKTDQKQSIVDEIDVPLIPANNIFAQHFTGGLDFLSIDAEGVDLAILKSINLIRFRPTIICIEAGSVIALDGYEMIARTPDNVIYGITDCQQPYSPNSPDRQAYPLIR